jgi:uroporphyrinogen-III synthase
MKFLLTRPAHANQRLIQQLEQKNIAWEALPCLEILPPHDPTNFEQALKNINQYTYVIVTSANVVNQTFKATQLKTKATWIAIGTATATALQPCVTQTILQPKTSNSEGILALSVLNDVKNQSILILTGENPRPLLAKTLAQRGAQITEAYGYRRAPLDYPAEKIEQIIQSDITHVVSMSQQNLEQLTVIFKNHLIWLQQRQLLVSSKKQAQLAQQLGFQYISLMKE